MLSNAEFERVKQRSILLMRREEWDRMKAQQGEQVSIDVEKTPISRLATEARLVAAVAERRSDYEVTVTIYREDAADAARGTPINVDRYMVWERIPNHLDFMKMVTPQPKTTRTCAASWKSTSLWSRSRRWGGPAVKRSGCAV